MTMDVRQRIALNQTQPTLTFEWPTGRPASAPSVYVYHPGYEHDQSPNPLVSAGTAVRSTVNTTANATASAGATTLGVTLRTGISVGDRLWLTDNDGRSERVEVVAVTAGAVNAGTLTLREPLSWDYASADVVASAVCTYQLSAALDTYWADEDEYADGWAVKWVVGSTVYWSYFDFGYTVGDWRYDIRDLVELDPELLAAQPDTDAGRRFAPQIDAAIEQVRLDIEARQMDPERVRGTDRLRELLRLRLAVNLCESGRMHRSRDPLVYADRYERRYQMRLAEMVTVGLRARYDADQTGLATARSAMRLVRGR